MWRQEQEVRGLPPVYDKVTSEEILPIESFIASFPRWPAAAHRHRRGQTSSPPLVSRARGVQGKRSESRDPIFRQPISIPASEHPSAHALFPAAVDQWRGSRRKK